MASLTEPTDAVRKALPTLRSRSPLTAVRMPFWMVMRLPATVYERLPPTFSTKFAVAFDVSFPPTEIDWLPEMLCEYTAPTSSDWLPPTVAVELAATEVEPLTCTWLSSFAPTSSTLSWPMTRLKSFWAWTPTPWLPAPSAMESSL